jgi:hypothetical protein
MWSLSLWVLLITVVACAAVGSVTINKSRQRVDKQDPTRRGDRYDPTITQGDILEPREIRKIGKDDDPF